MNQFLTWHLYEKVSHIDCIRDRYIVIVLQEMRDSSLVSTHIHSLALDNTNSRNKFDMEKSGGFTHEWRSELSHRDIWNQRLLAMGRSVGYSHNLTTLWKQGLQLEAKEKSRGCLLRKGLVAQLHLSLLVLEVERAGSDSSPKSVWSPKLRTPILPMCQPPSVGSEE